MWAMSPTRNPSTPRAIWIAMSRASARESLIRSCRIDNSPAEIVALADGLPRSFFQFLALFGREDFERFVQHLFVQRPDALLMFFAQLDELLASPIVYLDREGEGVHNGFPFVYYVTAFDTLTGGESEARAFVEERLETYDRMWDGCGCKVHYLD